MPRKKNIPKGSQYWKDQWEYQKENGEDKKQLERAKARRMYDKLGIDRKGKHIDHVKKLESGGKTTLANTRLRDPKANQADNLHKKGERKGKK